MNKSKEYYIKVERDFGFDATGDNKCKVAKTMNHKTLEDVKEFCQPVINLMQRELNGNGLQLTAVITTVIERLTELEKLKL